VKKFGPKDWWQRFEVVAAEVESRLHDKALEMGYPDPADREEFSAKRVADFMEDGAESKEVTTIGALSGHLGRVKMDIERHRRLCNRRRYAEAAAELADAAASMYYVGRCAILLGIDVDFERPDSGVPDEWLLGQRFSRGTKDLRQQTARVHAQMQAIADEKWSEPREPPRSANVVASLIVKDERTPLKPNGRPYSVDTIRKVIKKK